MFKIIVAALAVLLAATASPVFKDGVSSWNELVSGKGIFDEETDTMLFKQGDDATILKQLKELLGQDGVLENIYKNYRKRFSKTNDASPYRISHFENQLIDVATHNLEAQNGKHLWTKAVNQFTDMSKVELKNEYTEDFTEFMKTFKADMARKNTTKKANLKEAPDSINWKEQGYLTRIKNQYNCGSCCMFSSTATVEAVIAIANDDTAVSLSPQQLMDCAAAQNGFTCAAGGSDPNDSVNYLVNNGVATWEDYPYEPYIPSPEVGTCKAANYDVAGQVSSSTPASNINSDDLKNWVADGPVMAGIVVPPWDYGGGIVQASLCGDATVNHGISVVGYDEDEDGNKYWLIKNSFGEDYGEKGFFRLERADGDTRACDLGAWAYQFTY